VSGPEQLVLDLARRPALGRADFFVSGGNALALAQVDRWPDWPGGKLALIGPKGAGKTHLVHVWAARAEAIILDSAPLGELDVTSVPTAAALAVEDCDTGLTEAAEAVLFHLHNRLAAGGGSLLVTGVEAPARWDLRLPDLASRLRAAPVAALEAPDDALLAAVLVKLFHDRQLPVPPEVVAFLLPRMERSFEAAERLVARIDRFGLARRRAVTLRLAAEALQAEEAPEAG
jgi:chromosomal replication initiation ATPase DnaA